MKITFKDIHLILSSVAIVVTELQTVPECAAQPFGAPYTPPRYAVHISPPTNGPTVSVAVGVNLPDTCESVLDWGQPLLLGNTVSVDAQFWSVPLICLDVIITVSTQYNLGMLPPGNYNFVFSAWGTPIKTQAFLVPAPRPRLSVVPLGVAGARLSWPTNATGYSLECATNLPSETWVTVTNSPTAADAELVLTVDLAPGQKYYRLHSP